MGTENSKPEKIHAGSVKNLNDGRTEMAIEQALEQQRKMYEEKFEKLVKSQLRSETTVSHNINRDSNTPNIPQNPTNSSIGPLYPNLNVMTNNTIGNRQTVHHDLHKNHPRVLNTYEFQFSPAVPSAPAESDNYVDVTRTKQNNSNGAIPKSRFSPAVPSTPAKSVNDVDVTRTKQINNKGAIPKSRIFYNEKNKNNDSQCVNCVTCSSTLGLQIYQCNSGHSSCSQCRFLKKCCGICSRLITDMRNITLETFIAELQININDDERVKCPNTKDGCCLSFKKDAMEEHLKECPYKDIDCPLLKIFGICKWQGKVNHLLQHFKDLHPEHCFADVDKEMKILDAETEFYNVYFVNIGSFNFLIHIKRDLQKTIYMTATLFGTKFSALKWTYEFQVYNKKEPRRKFTYIDICNSFVTPAVELFEAGCCAVLDKQYGQSFFNNNELTYKFYIKKKIDSKKNMQKN
ncbi:unnamed protein product, partial [Brenthis ino]